MTPGYFASYAALLHDNGWPVIPIIPGRKEPACRGWQAYGSKPPSEHTLNRWLATRADHSIGIVCGTAVAIDVDILDPRRPKRDQAGQDSRVIVPWLGLEGANQGTM